MDELPVFREIVTDPPTDVQFPWIYVLTVVFLGLAILAIIVGAVVLLRDDKPVPDGMWTALGMAIGLLGGLLARGK